MSFSAYFRMGTTLGATAGFMNAAYLTLENERYVKELEQMEKEDTESIFFEKIGNYSLKAVSSTTNCAYLSIFSILSGPVFGAASGIGLYEAKTKIKDLHAIAPKTVKCTAFATTAIFLASIFAYQAKKHNQENRF